MSYLNRLFIFERKDQSIPYRILPVIIAQLAGASLGLPGNAVLPDLQKDFLIFQEYIGLLLPLCNLVFITDTLFLHFAMYRIL